MTGSTFPFGVCVSVHEEAGLGKELLLRKKQSVGIISEKMEAVKNTHSELGGGAAAHKLTKSIPRILLCRANNSL